MRFSLKQVLKKPKEPKKEKKVDHLAPPLAPPEPEFSYGAPRDAFAFNRHRVSARPASAAASKGLARALQWLHRSWERHFRHAVFLDRAAFAPTEEAIAAARTAPRRRPGADTADGRGPQR